MSGDTIGATGRERHEPAFCGLLRIGPQRAARDQVRRFLNAQLAARGHEVSFVDPLEYRLPLLDKMHKEYPAGAAPDPLPELADIIRSADSFVIVSGK